MRTVHETEALRPSDPVPKSMQSGPPGKSKLKIILKTPTSPAILDDGLDEAGSGDAHAEYFTALTDELFGSDELKFPVDKLYRKCYWEAKWAEDIGESLKKECKDWEDLYYKEWLEKEVLLSQVIKSEVDWHERRSAVLAGVADVQLTQTVEEQEGEQANGVAAGSEAEPSAAKSQATEATAAA